ncbi:MULTISPECIES: hypothetical protein [unclassified Fibrobacter]|uniref:hypothetical protein n=1 Tax=unclassified Fibrobacter TaxID=2634177 RepID=UPI000D7AF631|nr:MULTISPECIES: hypothetical protein [unclassified Fibrobacter]PWJ61734.1 hypothetical protein BGX12_12516 [Fibrobacter sp. UWR4]PZW67390.1 hypothetical protein C8E88_102516 [Fibrobacter sp. UWR1]
MIFKRLAVIPLLVMGMSFAQNAQSAQSNLSTNQEIQLSEDDLFLVQMLLMNDMFRENFVQSCTAEAVAWLGADGAAKTCSCAYDGLAKNQQLLLKFLNESENEEMMNKLGFELLETCLPPQFPKEMENAISKECLGGGVGSGACSCVVQNIKQKYTVKKFMKEVFENPDQLEKDIMDIATRCATKK